MRNALLAAAIVTLGMASTCDAETYVPPPASADALKGIYLSGPSVAGDFKKDFADCDRIPHVVKAVAQSQCFGLRRVDMPDPKNPRKSKHTWVKDASLPSSDANNNTIVLKLASGAVLFDAKMGIDNDGSPFAGKWPSNLKTSLFYSDGKTSINADQIRYIAVPSGFDDATGFELGDVAAVIYNGKVEFAVVADHGKSFRIGEGSVALHDALGHQGCQMRAADGNCKTPGSESILGGVTFIVFPDTKENLCKGFPPATSPTRLCPGMTPNMLNQRITDVGQAAFNGLKSADGR